MTLNIDDVLEVLQIVRETKDTELHIDTGEMKLSISRGKVSGTGSGFIEQGTVAQAPAAQIEAAAPAAVIAAPVAKQQADPQADPQAEATAPAADVESEAVTEEGLIPITADVTSVFYRKPSPEDSVYVEVGDEVEEDTVICLLEVMKCFRQVMAGTRGRVEKICVESSDMVEEGTVMFLIRPA